MNPSLVNAATPWLLKKLTSGRAAGGARRGYFSLFKCDRKTACKASIYFFHVCTSLSFIQRRTQFPVHPRCGKKGTSKGTDSFRPDL